MIITHSEMQTAKTCLRKEFLSYKLGIRPIADAKPLRMGKAFHEGLDRYKQGKIAGTSIDTSEIIRTIMDEYRACRPGMEDKRLYDYRIEEQTVAHMLNAYFWRWEQMDTEMEYIVSEQEFEMPIINPDSNRSSRIAIAQGKIDGIVKLSDGRLAVIEHKTTSDDLPVESDYWKRLRIDAQISLYYLAARHLGYDVQTVLYDVVKKPTILLKRIPILDDEGLKQVIDVNSGERVQNKTGSWKQAVLNKEEQTLVSRSETPQEYGQRYTDQVVEDPDRFLARKEIPRLEADIEEYQYELWQMTHLIHDCGRFGRWPRNTGACIGFGKCPYFDSICTDGYDITSGVAPEGFEIIENVHPELTEV